MGNNNGAAAQNENDIEYNRVGGDNQNNRNANNAKNKKKVHTIKNQSHIKKETIKLV